MNNSEFDIDSLINILNNSRKKDSAFQFTFDKPVQEDITVERLQSFKAGIEAFWQSFVQDSNLGKYRKIRSLDSLISTTEAVGLDRLNLKETFHLFIDSFYEHSQHFVSSILDSFSEIDGMNIDIIPIVLKLYKVGKSNEGKSRLAEVLKQNVDKIFSLFNSDPYTYHPLLLILAEINDELKKKVFDQYVVMWKTQRDVVVRLLINIDERDQPYKTLFSLIEATIFEKDKSRIPDLRTLFLQYDEAVLLNVLALAELEEKQPGAVKVLNERFGIHHFLRYPIEMLTDQFNSLSPETKQKKEKEEVEYYWIFTPLTGSEIAFQDKANYQDLLEQSKEIQGKKIKFRICEVSSAGDLFIKASRLFRLYGKASGGIVNAHGDIDQMYFGNHHASDSGTLTLDALKAPRAVRFKTLGVPRFFKPNPTLVFSSCSTGAHGGMGQEFSKGLDGVTIIAPVVAASIEKYVLKVENNKVIFDGIFNVDKKVYVNGKEVGAHGGDSN